VIDGRAPALVRLGLTTYEAKAYLGLITRDSATAAQVARLAGVPRQRIYDVLAALVEKGLAAARPGRVVKYAGVAPDRALERLLSDHRRRISALEHEARETIDALAPAFDAGRRQTDPLEYIEVLRDRAAINERFAALQAATKRELLIFTKAPYAARPEENVTGLELARAHRARSIYEFSIFEDPSFVEGVQTFIAAGEEARFVDELPLKLVIIDETIVLFGLQDPVAGREDLTLMIVEHPALASVLKAAFEAVWDRGLAFDEAQAHALATAAR
jgi:HTH-type transcriptional regulator, sugar sensing transcriptional regulator